MPDQPSDLLDLAPIIPVVVLDDVDQAVPLARALVDGGLPVVEVTLRTTAALDAIGAIARNVPEIVVGAGTVTSPGKAASAHDAGAQFLVSPGTTPALLAGMTDTGLPFLPGTATVSDALAVLEWGITSMKFFPAQASGGAAYLKSLVSPLPSARFCPTGGVTPDTAPDYLALDNVGCVGGSWLTPPDALATSDWERIEGLARGAAALGSA